MFYTSYNSFHSSIDPYSFLFTYSPIHSSTSPSVPSFIYRNTSNHRIR